MWLPEGRPGRTAYVWFCRTRCIGTTPALEPSASEKWNRTMAEEMVTFSVGSSRETLTGVPLGRVGRDHGVQRETLRRGRPPSVLRPVEPFVRSGDLVDDPSFPRQGRGDGELD